MAIKQHSITPLLIIGICVLLAPLITVLLAIFEPLSPTLQALVHTHIATSVVQTVVVIAAVCALTGIIGVGCAWIISTYQFVGSKLMGILIILPLAIPAYISAYALNGLVQSGGIIHSILLVFNPNTTYSVTTLGGYLPTIYTLTCSLFPYVYVVAYSSFSKEYQRYFEVAALHNVKFVLVRVAIKLAGATIIGALALVAMEVLNEYGTIVYFGMETISTMVYHMWSNYYDLTGAAQLSVAVVIVIVIVYGVGQKFRNTNKRVSSPLFNQQQRMPISIGGIRAVAAFGAVSLPVICGLIVPIGSILFWLFRAQVRIGALLSTLVTSIALAIVTTLCCVLFAIYVSYVVRLVRHSVARRLAHITTVVYALPGAMVGIAVLRMFGVGGGVVFIPILALLYAYIARYFAVCYYPLDGAFHQHWHNNTELAAQTLGSRYFKRLIAIHIPQMLPQIIGASMLIFLDILKELPLTFILRPIGVETLATQAFYYATEEQFANASPYALLIILIGMAFIVSIHHIVNRRGSATGHHNSPPPHTSPPLHTTSTTSPHVAKHRTRSIFMHTTSSRRHSPVPSTIIRAYEK